MAGTPSQPPARGGMSLYANLLETDSSASLSRDPVLNDEFKDGASAKKAVDPAFRFQPIRRPQVKQPVKPKPAFSKAPATIPTPAAAPAPAAPASAAAGTAVPRSTLADWAATEEDDYYYGGGGEKRQRGGRRKKKKKADDAPRETDWDELYDPARPTNVEEYLRSDERIREVREWKAVLYAHRRQKRSASYGSEPRSEDDEKPAFSNQYAPPPSLSFAPPPMSPPRATAPAPDDATGDDAYARRLAKSGQAPPPAAASSAPAPPPPPPPPPAVPTDTATISRAPVRYQPPPPPPEAMDTDMDTGEDEYDPEVNYASIPLPPSTSTPSQDQPHLPTSSTDADTPTSTRPGQKGFAQRLMAKYGWTRGAGLGAQGNEGITSALRVHVEKRRRRPDAEGGGFVDPKGGRGRIVAPKGKAKPNSGQGGTGGGRAGDAGDDVGAGGAGEQQQGQGPGKLSTVVLLQDMLENMADLEAEVEAGLGQEIGEECGEQYGRVERVVVDVDGRRVLIRFVEAVSALRAVNALQGRIFNGNAITARFYDEDKFEAGIYDE